MNVEQQKLLHQLAQLGEVTVIKNTRVSVVKAISEMDYEALEILLDDNINYQDTTKAIFIEKLKEIFIKFKQKDTQLIPHEGKCCSAECYNKDKAKVLFIGNITGDLLSLIIEQNESGRIKNMYDCDNFCIKNHPQEEGNNRYSIIIYKDEKVGFKPSISYTNLNEKFIKAIYELRRYCGCCEENFITAKEITYWVGNYKALFDSFKLPPKFFKEQAAFFFDYKKVKKIHDFLNLEEEAAQALADFKKIDLNNEIELLKWLVKHEHFHYHLISLHPNTISEDGIKNGREKLSDELVTCFNINILQNCIELETILDKYYYDMLNKYTTQTKEIVRTQTTFEGNYNEVDSLKYHLAKRGII
jgi:uncharacterized protein YjhX (UPF0386 family)